MISTTRNIVAVTLLATAALGAAQAQTAVDPAPAEVQAGHRSGPGWRAWRALDAVGATAEQKARIRAIYRKAATDLKEHHAEARTLRLELDRMLAAPTIDTRAVQGVHQQWLAVQAAAGQRRLQAWLDAAAVLTPTQRAQLHTRFVQGRELLLRQRQEREALFAPAHS